VCVTMVDGNLELYVGVIAEGNRDRDEILRAMGTASNRFPDITIVVGERKGSQSGSICSAVIHDPDLQIVLAALDVGTFGNQPHGPTYEWSSDRAKLVASIRTPQKGVLEPTMVEVFTHWLQGVLDQMGQSVSGAELELRRSVEILIDMLRRQVLENTELLNRLEERDQFVEQLEAQIRALEVELRRAKIDKRRVWPAVKFVGTLMLTGVASFGGGMAARPEILPVGEAAPHSQVVRLPDVDRQLAEVLRQCGVVTGGPGTGTP